MQNLPDIWELVNVGGVTVGVKTVSDLALSTTLALADVNFPIVVKVGPSIVKPLRIHFRSRHSRSTSVFLYSFSQLPPFMGGHDASVNPPRLSSSELCFLKSRGFNVRVL